MASSKTLSDSGLGSSLLSTPAAVVVQDLNISRESGEIVDDIEDQQATQSEELVENGYLRGSLYVASSLAERLVLDRPPAPKVGKLHPTPNARATLITDRVGRQLSAVDKIIVNQCNIARD